jgi:hypothetical protein
MEFALQKYKPGKEITLLELIEECELEQKMKDEEESASRNSKREREENPEMEKNDL